MLGMENHVDNFLPCQISALLKQHSATIEKLANEQRRQQQQQQQQPKTVMTTKICNYICKRIC